MPSSNLLLDQLVQTNIQLLLHEPFYAQVLMGLVKEENTEIRSMSLGLTPNKTIKLAIHPDFWHQQLVDPQGRKTALKHEVLHLCFLHPLRGRQFRHQRLFHLAADLQVNQWIDPLQLPPDAVTLAQLPELNLLPFQSVDYYYEALEHCWNTMLRRGTQHCPALQGWMEGGTAARPGHELWSSDFGGLSAAERQIVRPTIEQRCQEAFAALSPTQQNQLPALLRIHLDQPEQRATARVNWRRQLRLFVGAGQRTFLQSTIHQASRRYGTTPGLRIRKRHKIAVVLDTSGSIDEFTLQCFFQEIHHLWQLGIQVLVLECDTRVHRTYPYRGQMPPNISGRGDTRFDAALEYLNRYCPADAAVYFTDGRGPAPQLSCRLPLLWLVWGEGPSDHLPGSIRLDLR